MRDDLAKELEQIGLSENEAKVYLAGLELGPATAQQLAAKAIVSRPNTYIMIESLIKRGLMSSFMKGKKKMYVSGQPTQLLYILDQQRKRIEEKTESIKKIIDSLENERPGATDVPVVAYEGQESFGAIQKLLLENKDEVFEIVPIDIVRKYLPPVFQGDKRQEFSKHFKIKSLYTSEHGPQNFSKPNVEYKYLPPEKFPVESEILIFGNRVVISNFDTQRLSVHLIDEKISKTLKSIFSILWDQANDG